MASYADPLMYANARAQNRNQAAGQISGIFMQLAQSLPGLITQAKQQYGDKQTKTELSNTFQSLLGDMGVDPATLGQLPDPNDERVTVEQYTDTLSKRVAAIVPNLGTEAVMGMIQKLGIDPNDSESLNRALSRMNAVETVQGMQGQAADPMAQSQQQQPQQQQSQQPAGGDMLAQAGFQQQDFQPGAPDFLSQLEQAERGADPMSQPQQASTPTAQPIDSMSQISVPQQPAGPVEGQTPVGARGAGGVFDTPAIQLQMERIRKGYGDGDKLIDLAIIEQKTKQAEIKANQEAEKARQFQSQENWTNRIVSQSDNNFIVDPATGEYDPTLTRENAGNMGVGPRRPKEFSPYAGRGGSGKQNNLGLNASEELLKEYNTFADNVKALSESNDPSLESQATRGAKVAWLAMKLQDSTGGAIALPDSQAKEQARSAIGIVNYLTLWEDNIDQLESDIRNGNLSLAMIKDIQKNVGPGAYDTMTMTIKNGKSLKDLLYKLRATIEG